jgi:hypothetical protein
LSQRLTHHLAQIREVTSLSSPVSSYQIAFFNFLLIFGAASIGFLLQLHKNL